MILSDQPGRIIGLLIFSPSLLISGILLITSNKLNVKLLIGYLLIVYSIIFFIYELFWVIFYPAKMVKIDKYREKLIV